MRKHGKVIVKLEASPKLETIISLLYLSRDVYVLSKQLRKIYKSKEKRQELFNAISSEDMLGKASVLIKNLSKFLSYMDKPVQNTLITK